MNVLVIVVQGLQPAFVGCYGSETVPTPTLDRWASEGVVFDQHYADRPDVGSKLWREHFRQSGFRVVRVGPRAEPDGWDAEFVAVRDRKEPLLLKPTRRALRQALATAGADGQTLIWIEIDALLPPWQVPEEMLEEQFVEDEPDEESLTPWPASEPLPATIEPDDLRTLQRLQRTYGAAVATLDAGLEKLLADCEKRGWDEATVRVLTADRGFPLGEHGVVGHAHAGLFEELVHLPLLVRLPGLAEARRRVADLTQPDDLAAWLAEWADHQLPGVRERIVMRLEDGSRRESALRTADWFLRVVEEPGAEPRAALFEKPADRWEVNDLRMHHLDMAEQLEQELRPG